MKEEIRITISEMQDRLQSRMHYADPESAMKTLLICFEKAKKYRGWTRDARRRGVIPRVAHEFAQYVGYPIDKN